MAPTGAGEDDRSAGDRSLTRREVLAGGAASLLAWAPALRMPVRAISGRTPPFPAGVELYRQSYVNWAHEVMVDDVWTCVPRTAEDVLRVVRWASAADFRVRARGFRHNWSPLTVSSQDRDRVLLVDTTQHLTRMRLSPLLPQAVQAQTGASMDDLFAFLDTHGLGLVAAPCLGDITIGGGLAINGHGTAVPARGERLSPGGTYGSLSNLILSLTAVVWNGAQGDYELRTFERDDPDCAALLTSLGRSFLTEVTLQAQVDQKLRCVSHLDIPDRELFARPGSGARRTVAALAAATGRVEVIWFPFTNRPWVKVWSVRPTKPRSSVEVHAPYNYPFSDNLPPATTGMLSAVANGAVELTPELDEAMWAVTAAGLSGGASDLWGSSKNLLLYVRPGTPRASNQGLGVHLRRADVQRAVSLFAEFHLRQLAAYRRRGQYPMNLPVEMRLSGLDRSADVRTTRAVTPLLSLAGPHPDRPDWDTVLWLNLNTLPGTPGAHRFSRELETWGLRTFAGDWAEVKPEWAKGFAYTDDGPWTNEAVLRTTRERYGERWTQAAEALDHFDRHGLFRNHFLDALFDQRG